MLADWSVSFNQRRRTCVLDPALVLRSPLGPELAVRLASWLELWLPRSFWHVLDSSEYFLRHPGRLLVQEDMDNPQRHDDVRLALRLWEQRRRVSDAGNLPFFWLADCTSESSLSPAWQNGAGVHLIAYYEALHIALSVCELNQVRSEVKADELRELGMDVAALAVALGSAVVLTGVEAGMPLCCRALSELGIACQSGTPESANELATTEQACWRELLVHAGVAPVLWSGLKLAVVHILAPAAALLSVSPGELDVPLMDSLTALEADSQGVFDASPVLAPSRPALGEIAVEPWHGARAYWFNL